MTRLRTTSLAILLIVIASFGMAGDLALAVTQQTGSIGVEGTVPGNPPSQAPTITVPKNGQVFTEIPINVAGLCQTGLLVEIFKNNVFAGSVQCAGGSFSLKIDLFNGRNDLVARQYDALNQASPDSNVVTVTLTNNLPQTGPRLSLTTQYAKRGANPGDKLSWPLTISGGTPPYAISVDWGDKSTTDLMTRPFAGDFTISHNYLQSGIYIIIVKATDSNGQAVFLQVVGVANGPIQQHGATTTTTVTPPPNSKWVILTVMFLLLPVLISSFWLGKKHQLQTIRNRLRRGQRPF